MRAKRWALVAIALVLAGCGERRSEERIVKPRSAPVVSVRDDSLARATWRPPPIDVTAENASMLADRADAALAERRFIGGADTAIPLFLALSRHEATRIRGRAGLANAVTGLLQDARSSLAVIDEDPAALDRLHEAADVLRVVALERPDVQRLLQRVDRVDEGQFYSEQGEKALAAGDAGEHGRSGAIVWFRRALALRPGDARARQGLAAAESQLIRRAEDAAARDDYASADAWLDAAATVRPDHGAVASARAGIAFRRATRIGQLRDAGVAALATPMPRGIEVARGHLAHILRIAPPADPTAAELRRRIDYAVHYGAFEPGQRFTDALRNGGRTPRMRVIPHGGFHMGSTSGQTGSTDSERPVRHIRFRRGIAISLTEVTVAQFRQFVEATAYRPRSVRRGYSVAYDLRSGNFARRGNVDWRHDYVGRLASDNLPVIHISAKDASAYAEWLAQETGYPYRLPSEAEFEYALRAGNPGIYPWGNGPPPPGSGNFTGQGDVSPIGRRWQNAFRGYLDGAWGPAPVGRYAPGRFGLHDMAGNVSEWVADCWHASYRRAPRDARPWVNPGCRQRVVRGGSWASSPEQTRSAWRSGFDADTTNARIGFRVVREL